MLFIYLKVKKSQKDAFTFKSLFRSLSVMPEECGEGLEERLVEEEK